MSYGFYEYDDRDYYYEDETPKEIGKEDEGD